MSERSESNGGGGNRTPVPDAKTPEKQAISENGCTESGTPGDDSASLRPVDRDLARLILAWPALAPAVRLSILALIGSTDKGVDR